MGHDSIEACGKARKYRVGRSSSDQKIQSRKKNMLTVFKTGQVTTESVFEKFKFIVWGLAFPRSKFGTASVAGTGTGTGRSWLR